MAGEVLLQLPVFPVLNLLPCTASLALASLLGEGLYFFSLFYSHVWVPFCLFAFLCVCLVFFLCVCVLFYLVFGGFWFVLVFFQVCFVAGFLFGAFWFKFVFWIFVLV